jgi:hypothetical protein
MAHTTSRLRTKLSTEAQNNEGQPWSNDEAMTEILADATDNLGVAPVNTTADPGSDATKAVAIQGVTAGKPIPTAAKQYTGVPSSFAIQTADQTVFTLATGEVGFIQNLSADAPLAVKKGASASTTSLNFILPKATAASDGTSLPVKIEDWVGVVSVAKMTGTASYLAYKQAP